MVDHYRTLGVTPSADDAAIRAAYLALIRRFHPDQNPSAEAAEQAKRVSAAYGVLSDPERRAAYDRQLAGRAVPHYWAEAKAPPRGRIAFAAMTFAAIGLLGFALTRPPGNGPGVVPDAAGPRRASAAQELACPERLDAAEIRRALFAGNAGRAPADPSAFRLAELSTDVRASPVTAEGSALLGNLRCRASVSLVLPSGIATAGGSGSLLADIWFVPPSGEGAPLLIETDEVVSEALRTLARTPDAVKPAPPPPLPEIAERAPPSPPVVAPKPAAPRPPAPSRTVALPPPSPAIDLAALERHQNLLYQQSYRAADEAKRSRLLTSRAAFLSRLGGCATDSCRRDAYLSRNQEIAAIMGS